jgi:hypothetical protein
MAEVDPVFRTTSFCKLAICRTSGRAELEVSWVRKGGQKEEKKGRVYELNGWSRISTRAAARVSQSAALSNLCQT